MSTQAQRRSLAAAIAAIAVNHGASVEITTAALRDRTVYLQCEWPGKVKVAIDVDDLHKGGLCAHFHQAERLLRGHIAFDSVNQHHWRKATVYRDNAEGFKSAFTRACEAIASGDAFQDGT